MNIFERRLRKLDAFQQRRPVLGFSYGVIKRFGNVNGSSLVVQLTYAMFTTVFPLLLLLITIMTFLLAGDPSIRDAVLKSTFGQFPLVGSQLGSNIHVLRRDSEIAFVVSLLGLAYGTTSLAGSGIYAMQQIWDIKRSERLNYIRRLGRGVRFLLVLALGVALTTLLAGAATLGKHNLLLRIITELLVAIVNILIYVAAFRTLTPRKIATQDLVYGAIFGGIAWTILQALGSYIVGHYLRNDNATYGVFGGVLGLMAWLYLSAEITLYAAVLNNVKKYHLWPRSIFGSSSDR